MQYHRRSIRLLEYDYASYGWYFVTICVQDREMYFENNDIKQMIDAQWQELKNKFNNIDLNEYVIMPNHLHGIIVINDSVGADPCVCPDNGIINKSGDGVINNQGAHIPNQGAHIPNQGAHIPNQGAHTGAPLQRQKPTLGKIIQWFKTMTTNKYIQNIKINNWSWFTGRLWQRNYYERIIRNNQELNRIRQYIINNPDDWETDKNNPKNFNS